MNSEGAAPEEPVRTPRRGTWLLLLLGSFVISGIICWALFRSTGLPLGTSLIIALLFLCTDLVALTMLWYVTRGGAARPHNVDERDPWAG